MNYRVRRQGQDLGALSLEELRRRRETGELTGSEYVQGEGMSDWQPLDLVLQQGYRVVPPPLPPSDSKRGLSQGAIWLIVTGGVIFCIAFIGFIAYVGYNVERGFRAATSSGSHRSLEQPRPDARTAASKPIVVNSNSLTERAVLKRARKFRIRQWVAAYETHGPHGAGYDAEATQFLQAWIDSNYGGPAATNKTFLQAESDRLANNPDCRDPLVLTVVADNSLNYFDAARRFSLSATMADKSSAGRISKGPTLTPGCSDIKRMAWFRSRASSTRMPPNCSLVSA